MTKNNRQFREFLRDEVNLSKSKLDRLITGIRGVDGYLKDNLSGYQKMEPQGSYALGTAIKPVDDDKEYDADIQIVMNPNPIWEPREYIKAIYNALKENQTYSGKIDLHNRCVTVDYAGDFHLDVVPRITIEGSHHICNIGDNEFEETDGIGYREWFNEKNRITEGNLKRVVRLLKYLRDHKNYTDKSILLTTLAGNTIESSDEGTEAVKTVSDTLVTVLTRMDDYLQKHSDMPEIRNPALPSETFNRHWDQKKYDNFRDRVHSHAQTAKEAKANPSIQDAIRAWRKLFGDNFGRGSSGTGNDGGGNRGGGSPRNPSGSQGGSQPPPVVAPVRPRKPYASRQAPGSRCPESVSVPISDEDIQRLTQEQSGLSYDAENHRIIGVLEFSAEYDQSDGWLRPTPLSTIQRQGKSIHDTFEIEIRLEFQPTVWNPWPPVIETDGRIQRIMEKHQIADIADMHCYPDLSENLCCLGLKAATDYRIEITQFVRDLVVPFFYRVAYVERHGLRAAQHDLWGEYSHYGPEAYKEYLTELQNMRSTGRNQPCPCGSGSKYKKCHLQEVNDARTLVLQGV